MEETGNNDGRGEASGREVGGGRRRTPWPLVVVAVLFVVVPFRWFDRISENHQVKAFVGGVTAAASGAIAGACVVLARRAISDLPTSLIALVALGITWRVKMPEPVLIAAGGAVGLMIAALRG